MKFFIDENSHLQIADILAHIYPQHDFLTYAQEQLAGMDDVPLFETLGRRGFHGIITGDQRQTRVPEEKAALIQAGLHWIGHSRAPVGGPKGILLTVASVVAGFPFVLEWIAEQTVMQGFFIRGVTTDASQRVKRLDF